MERNLEKAGALAHAVGGGCAWRKATMIMSALLVSAAATGCDDTVQFEEPEPFVPPAYDEWVAYEPEGTVCSDGTQYRYFVKFRENSENVLVLFEGGGACWDYNTCTAAAGSLGARGVDCVLDDNDEFCIPYDYADRYFGLPAGVPDDLVNSIVRNHPHISVTNGAVSIDTVLPLASSNATISPMHDWNLVFVPYCTADLYAGNRVAVYEDPDGVGEPITFHHLGLQNTLKVAEELNEMFPNVPQFAMNGCSAGGAGVMATYYFFRTRMEGIQRGYVFSDAGPFFPSQQATSRSLPLHNAVREAWDISSVFDLLIAETDILDEEPVDVSELYRAISQAFPNDRFSVAHTQTDFNYSLYSYTSFYGLTARARSAAERAVIYEYWRDDNDLLVDLLEELPNMAYYMPFWRRTNDSHCISLAGFQDADPSGDELLGILAMINDPLKFYAGTEIEVDGQVLTYRDHVINVLNDDEELVSVFELDGEGPYLECTPDYFDEDGCFEVIGQ